MDSCAIGQVPYLHCTYFFSNWRQSSLVYQPSATFLPFTPRFSFCYGNSRQLSKRGVSLPPLFPIEQQSNPPRSLNTSIRCQAEATSVQPRVLTVVQTSSGLRSCNECYHTKFEEDFERSASSVDGKSETCRACLAALRARRSGRELYHLALSPEEAWEQAKKCSTCGNTKELRDFARCRDGTAYRCRGCQSQFVKRVWSPADAPQECLTCLEVKPPSDFHRKQHRPNGIAGECKKCVRKRERARYLAIRETKLFVNRTTKVCAICRQAKETAEFHRAAYTIDGLQSKCKKCWRQETAERGKKNRAVDEG